MIMYYVSIAIAILSTALHQVSQRLTPRGLNPPEALMLTYSAATVLTALLQYCMPVKRGMVAELRQLKWASLQMAISIVGLEVGFLLVYRAGGVSDGRLLS